MLLEKWIRGKCCLYYDVLVLYDVFVVIKYKIYVFIVLFNCGIFILNVYIVNIIVRRRMFLIVRKVCILEVFFYIIVKRYFDNLEKG